MWRILLTAIGIQGAKTQQEGYMRRARRVVFRGPNAARDGQEVHKEGQWSAGFSEG